MKHIGRLNGIIRALEAGQPAFVAFARAEPEEALQLGASDLDAILFEMEHGPFDVANLRDALQYLLNRRRIVEAGSLAPSVTPLVRIPANGAELNQWQAKQALDMGVYGIVWPHVSTVEQARNAVAACRYARPPTAEYFEPRGIRGDGPVGAARYWGLTQQEYYRKADVWPLNPEGEILVILMIESTEAIENLPDILQVPGVGAIMIGEGDLSQQLGHPRQYDHPVVIAHKARVLAAAKAACIPVAHPHANAGNVEQAIADGYSILFTTPARSFAGLEKGRAAAISRKD